jgi:hypothetical protein
MLTATDVCLVKTAHRKLVVSKVRGSMTLAMESVYRVLVHVLNPILCAPRTAAVGVPVLLVLCSMMRVLSVSTHAPAPENVCTTTRLINQETSGIVLNLMNACSARA